MLLITIMKAMRWIMHTVSGVFTDRIFTIRSIGIAGTMTPIFTIRFIILHGIIPPSHGEAAGVIAGTHHIIAGDGDIHPTAMGTVHTMPGTGVTTEVIMEGIMEDIHTGVVIRAIMILKITAMDKDVQQVQV